MKVALLGNPNSGKTTLFNVLTGEYQKTGNFIGVTTEKKTGKCKYNKDIIVVDLPGIYSFSADSNDHKNAMDFLREEKPDAIINIVDGTNLERNLYLTTLISSLRIPTVIAVNMCDDLEKNGIKVNCGFLEGLFGMPTVLISALKKKNIEKLIDTLVKNEIKPKCPVKNLDTKSVFSFIEDKIDEIITKKKTRREIFTFKADEMLLNKYLGFPILFLVITLVCFLTLKIGGFFSGYIVNLIDGIAESIKAKFISSNVTEWFISLTCDGLIKGVGAVISFLPQILVLFFLMTILEESGYASRIAFLCDRLFNFFGLNGKSVMPLILSCGCTVSGIMATRTIDNESERIRTVFLVPFMPCGAKTAVFCWLSEVLFSGSAIIAAVMYFLGIVATAVFGRLLLIKNKNKIKENFLLEIPPLRFPSFYDIICVLREKIKEFMLKAGSVIFLVTLALWGLINFGFSGFCYNDVEKSFLFGLGNILKYIFYPLGFKGWQTSVSLLSGILAKEAVAESLKMVSGDMTSLFSNGFSAFSFMVFILLSPPCMGAIATAKKEIGNKNLIKMIAFETFVAYISAFIINLMGIIYYSLDLLFYLIVGIITLVLIVFAVKSLKRTCNKTCKNCKGNILCKIKSKHNTTS